MLESLDIQKVINTSTSRVSIDDLTKKGFKQVKVLNQVLITKLIGEAVDNVLAERSKEISKDERERVIKEARGQFEVLAKKRLEKERTRIGELETANSSLSSELESLQKRLAASVEVQAARDQALAKVQLLQNELTSKNPQVERLQAAEARAVESEKRAAVLEGQLVARCEELERGRSAAANEGVVEKLLLAMNERLTKAAQPGEINQIMLSLDTLSRRLSNMSSSGGGGDGADIGSELRKDVVLGALFDQEKEGAIESNVAKIKVRENKAKGVAGSLAKLKKLQMGDTET